MKMMHIPILAVIAGVTAAILIGFVMTVAVQASNTLPARTQFNFKVKECKVDSSPDPVSCKDVKKTLKQLGVRVWNLDVEGSNSTTLTIKIRP